MALKRPHSIQTDEEMIEEAARMDALFGEIAIRTFAAVREIRDYVRREVAKQEEAE